MTNITNNVIKFNDLEEKMWKKKMQEGLDELRNQLRRIDNQLLKDKDNAELEVKDFQKTTIKCKFGDLEFYRRRYKLTKNGKTKMVYLLDIYLELGYSGQYSQSIVELVLREATEKSYRKTAETIRETTNVSITHTAARRILIDFSENHIKKLEKEKLKLYEKGFIEGKKEQKMIYEKSDEYVKLAKSFIEAGLSIPTIKIDGKEKQSSIERRQTIHQDSCSSGRGVSRSSC